MNDRLEFTIASCDVVDVRHFNVAERLCTGGVEDQRLSTHRLTRVPTLWSLLRRRSHRIFKLR